MPIISFISQVRGRGIYLSVVDGDIDAELEELVDLLYPGLHEVSLQSHEHVV